MLFHASVVKLTMLSQFITIRTTSPARRATTIATTAAIPPPIATAIPPNTPTRAAIASTTGAIATTTWISIAIIPASTATTVIIVAASSGFCFTQSATAEIIGVITGTIACSTEISRFPSTGISGWTAWRICAKSGASCLIASPTTGPSVAAICPNVEVSEPIAGASAGSDWPSASAPWRMPSKRLLMPLETAGSARSLARPEARELMADPADCMAEPREEPREGREVASSVKPGFMLSTAWPADLNKSTSAWWPSTVDMARFTAASPSARPERVDPPASWAAEPSAAKMPMTC